MEEFNLPHGAPGDRVTGRRHGGADSGSVKSLSNGRWLYEAVRFPLLEVFVLRLEEFRCRVLSRAKSVRLA